MSVRAPAGRVNERMTPLPTGPTETPTPDPGSHRSTLAPVEPGIGPAELLGDGPAASRPTPAAPKTSVSQEAAPASPLPRRTTTGLGVTTVAALVCVAALLAWQRAYASYFSLAAPERAFAEEHAWLRPAAGAGLAFGVGSAAVVLLNITLPLRRTSMGRKLGLGAPRWMSLHMVFGIVAIALAVAHAGFAPRDTAGGRALLAMACLAVTGALTRIVTSRRNFPAAPRIALVLQILHRVLAIAAVAVAAAHIATALRYASVGWNGVR